MHLYKNTRNKVDKNTFTYILCYNNVAFRFIDIQDTGRLEMNEQRRPNIQNLTCRRCILFKNNIPMNILHRRLHVT
jgi:hypothetical protein